MKAAAGRLPVVLMAAAALAALGAGEMFYYDPASVTTLSGRNVGVVVTETGSDGSRTLTRAEVDCTNRIMRGLEVTRELPNRAPEVSHEPEDWRAMESDPFLSRLLRALCG